MEFFTFHRNCMHMYVCRCILPVWLISLRNGGDARSLRALSLGSIADRCISINAIAIKLCDFISNLRIVFGVFDSLQLQFTPLTFRCHFSSSDDGKLFFKKIEPDVPFKGMVVCQRQRKIKRRTDACIAHLYRSIRTQWANKRCSAMQ